MRRQIRFAIPVTTLTIMPVLAMVTALLPTTVAAQTTVYVDGDQCPNSGAGTEVDPFCRIQDAIVASANGDEIIVAPGTYNELINFIGKGVTLRSSGGRDVTIIDASLVPDPGTGKPVVRCESGEGPDTVLDGFTVTGGTGDTSLFGSGNHGGGMFINDSNPTVINCTFSGNTALGGGGGGMDNVSSSPTITNCSFDQNTSSNGGGMMNHQDSSPTVTNCTFTGNAQIDGGGAGGMGNNINCSPVVTNCVFTGNTAEVDGGGMVNSHGTSNPTVANCTFSRNTAGRNGGGVNNFQTDNPSFSNCIFMGNSAGASGDQIANDRSTCTVSFSDIQGSMAGGIWDSLLGIDAGGNIDADPLFVDADGGDNIVGTVDDDLRLLSGSPAIDAGDNFALSGCQLDLDGNSRRYDDPGTADTGNGNPPIVDMGAYEFGSSLPQDCNSNGVPDECELRGASELVAAVLPPGLVHPPNEWGPVLVFGLDAQNPLVPEPQIPAGLVSDPSGVVFDPQKGLFVGNRNGGSGGSISRFVRTPAGGFEVSGTITGNGLDVVHGVALSPDGELFAANFVNGTISRFLFDEAGIAVPNGSFATGANALGVAVSASNEVLVTSGLHGTVWRFLLDSVSGEAVANGSFAVPGASRLHFSNFDDDGRLYIADINAGAVFRCDFDGGGQPTCSVFVTVPGAIGVAIRDQAVYVSVHGSGGVHSFDLDATGQPIASGFVATASLGGIALISRSLDCNGNTVPDECEDDFNQNGVPDECDPDCNENDIADFLDIALQFSEDCNGDEIPDECQPPVIVSSDPRDGFIDVRQDMSSSGTTPQGVDRIRLTFADVVVDAETQGELTPSSFVLVDTSGERDILEVVAIDSVPNTYEVVFVDPIAPGTWTTLIAEVESACGVLTDADEGDRIDIGFLPGDVDASGMSNPADILALIDSLNNVTPLPFEQTDINRSNLASPSDIIRLIDLLNGANSTQPWNGATLPPRP